MDFLIWPVTQRLYMDRKKPNWPTKKELLLWAYLAWVKYGNKYNGIITSDRYGLWFVSWNVPNWWRSVGFIPHFMPRQDEKQPVPRGRTTWFRKHLVSLGFKFVRGKAGVKKITGGKK